MLDELWHAAGGRTGPASAHPGMVLLYERHLVDLSGIEDLAQAKALTESELQGKPDGMAVAVIAMPTGG